MTLKLSVNLGAAGGVRHKRFRPGNGLERACARGQTLTNQVSSSTSA